MATLTKTYSHSGALQRTEGLSAYDRLIENLKFSHFAVISMSILIGSCLGGIAAMYVFMSGAPFWQFLIGLAVSMANLVACIAQAPTKWVVNFFLLSVLVNSILVLSHLL